MTTRRRSQVYVSLPFEQMTETGAIGRPDLATAEKGHKLLDVIAERVADFVREFARWPWRPRMAEGGEPVPAGRRRVDT
jgi:creatinine amidohydrolase/Fe(II)-dependent formamide hydrolase-like protein